MISRTYTITTCPVLTWDREANDYSRCDADMVAEMKVENGEHLVARYVRAPLCGHVIGDVAKAERTVGDIDRQCQSTTVRRSSQPGTCACCTDDDTSGYICTACGEFQCRECVESNAGLVTIVEEDARSLWTVTFKVGGKRGTITWQQYHPTADAARASVERMAAREFYGSAITIVSVEAAPNHGMDDVTRARLVMALSAYDRRQQARPASWNPYALPQYLGALQNAAARMADGTPLRAALVASFCGRLLDACLRAVGEPTSTMAECQGAA